MVDTYTYRSAGEPLKRLGGLLTSTRPDEPDPEAVPGLLDRLPDGPVRPIDLTVWGPAKGAGGDKRILGPMPARLSSAPTATRVSTVKRLCAFLTDALTRKMPEAPKRLSVASSNIEVLQNRAVIIENLQVT